MNYLEYIQSHTLSCDANYRGGTIKIDVSDLFPDLNEDATCGCYQNYLGGGLLGSIQCGYMFDPKQLNQRNQTKLAKLMDTLKRYFHSLTNHADDEWESATYEQNQKRPVSAY